MASSSVSVSANDALPDLAGIDRIELYADETTPAAVIPVADGTRLSAAIYLKMAVAFGGIGPKAAALGIALYERHAPQALAEARATPGRHPNIDRLFGVLASGEHYSVRARRAV